MHWQGTNGQRQCLQLNTWVRHHYKAKSLRPLPFSLSPFHASCKVDISDQSSPLSSLHPFITSQALAREVIPCSSCSQILHEHKFSLSSQSVLINGPRAGHFPFILNLLSHPAYCIKFWLPTYWKRLSKRSTASSLITTTLYHPPSLLP